MSQAEAREAIAPWAYECVGFEKAGYKGLYLSAVAYHEKWQGDAADNAMTQEAIAREVTAAGFSISQQTTESPVWLWDDVNDVIQDETKRKIRVSDIDGAVHMYEGERVLFLEGTTRTNKPDTGQVAMLQSIAKRPGQSVITFVGELPYPPQWVIDASRAWSRGEIEGWITEAKWTIRIGHHPGAGASKGQ